MFNVTEWMVVVVLLLLLLLLLPGDGLPLMIATIAQSAMWLWRIHRALWWSIADLLNYSWWTSEGSIFYTCLCNPCSTCSINNHTSEVRHERSAVGVTWRGVEWRCVKFKGSVMIVSTRSSTIAGLFSLWPLRPFLQSYGNQALPCIV